MPKIKAVLKVCLHNDRTKKKAMVVVSGMKDMAGVDTILLDMKAEKITLIGDIDPVVVVCKMRKVCRTDIIQLEEVKPPAAAEQIKKPVEKKNEGFSCDHFYGHPPPVTTHFNYYQCPDENPNACAIC